LSGPIWRCRQNLVEGRIRCPPADQIGKVGPALAPAGRQGQFIDNELIEALLALPGFSAESRVHLGRYAPDGVLNGV
jgi:hypothetical protein